MEIIIFGFVVLIFSAVIHEVAHGYVAEHLGDPTARNAGRLTLNPLKHLDPFGSVIMPILLYIVTNGAFFFAAAKPVPYDPRNLRDPRWGGAKIALAGPATNFVLAIIFGIVIRILAPMHAVSGLMLSFFGLIVLINILLGIFNLVPIPPLDGSRILFALLPQTQANFRLAYMLERWGLLIVLIFVFYGFGILQPLINFLFAVITGQTLGL